MPDSERKIQKARFSPWYYERELALYDEKSRSGWHLIRRTARDVECEYDPTVQYRYAADYRAGHQEERYLELFAEDGWECIGILPTPFDRRASVTLLGLVRPLRPHPAEGCWYIFRKKCAPSLREEDYRIFSGSGELLEQRHTLSQSCMNHGIGSLVAMGMCLIVGLFAPVAFPLVFFTPYFLAAAVIQFDRGASLGSGRGKLPRHPADLFPRLVATVLLLAGFVGLFLFWDRTLHISYGFVGETGRDPVTFLREYMGYLQEGDEYDVWATDTLTIVLTAEGQAYYFYKTDPADKTWTMSPGGMAEDGFYYTVPAAFCCFNGSCRLMGDDGTVYEPLYEAEFSTGTFPIFALDISGAQEYRCVLYTVDEDGLRHFDRIRTEYTALAGTEPVPEFSSFTSEVLLLLPGGTEFLRSYNLWRESFDAAAPKYFNSGAWAPMGTNTAQPFHATYSYPPCLELTRRDPSGMGVSAVWMTNGYGEYLVYGEEGELLFLRSSQFAAELMPLTDVPGLSAGALQQAAGTMMSSDIYYGTVPRCYGGVTAYETEFPAELAELWAVLP